MNSLAVIGSHEIGKYIVRAVAPTQQYAISVFTSKKQITASPVAYIDAYFVDLSQNFQEGMDIARSVREKNSQTKIIAIILGITWREHKTVKQSHLFDEIVSTRSNPQTIVKMLRRLL